MERRVGQHDAEGILIRSDRMGNGGIFLPSQNDDRPFDTQQEPFILLIYFTMLSYLLHIPAHHGKGFILTEFSGSEGRYRPLIFRITGKVKSPNAFDRKNGPFPKQV